MKKSLLVLAIATLMVSVSGCGCCRGWFGKRTPLATTIAAPVYSQCAPTCAPVCTAGCDSGCSSCGGGVVSYGYNGGVAMPAGGAVPMAFPSGTTYGQ